MNSAPLFPRVKKSGSPIVTLFGMFSPFREPLKGRNGSFCVNRERRQADGGVRTYNEGDGFFYRNTFGKCRRHSAIEFSDTTGATLT